MLILGRKSGEAICLGDDVKITVVQIDRNTVKLGVVAPDDVIAQDTMLRPVNSMDDNSVTSLKRVVGTSQNWRN